VTLARPEPARKKRAFGRWSEAHVYLSWQWRRLRHMGHLRRVVSPFADRAASRDAPSSPPALSWRVVICIADHEGLPRGRRLRKRHITAQQESGCSEASAASSVPAFWLTRVTLGVLSRVTDVAAS